MLRIGVVFGGKSGEHEVSIVSGASIIQALNTAKYAIIPIGITKTGEWYCGEGTLEWFRRQDGAGTPPARCYLTADPSVHGLLVRDPDGTMHEEPIDVIFPVLHGTFGEDGTMQGLLELADIPYVGSGVLGSAIGMDKVFQKILHKNAGLPVVEYEWVSRSEYAADPAEFVQRVENRLGYPVFVKPPNLGSSVGISKAGTREELEHGIATALLYDAKVIVEKAVPSAREIEVAVLGNEAAIASVPGEIFPSNEFYDYDAKYVDGASRMQIPAEIPAELVREIRRMALAGFHAIGCDGMARVDFLCSRDTGEVFINEVNTIPGFTSISMYPKMMEAMGVGYGELLDRLIMLALDRHAERRRLTHSFSPRIGWHLQD